jgi:hypothetical protein
MIGAVQKRYQPHFNRAYVFRWGSHIRNPSKKQAATPLEETLTGALITTLGVDQQAEPSTTIVVPPFRSVVANGERKDGLGNW